MFSQKAHHYILLGAFVLLAIGMPSTKVLMSFGLVFAIANWFLEGKFQQKYELLKTNRMLIYLLLFFGIFIAGLLWSWDVSQGVKDVKSRLPLLALPLILGTSKPFSKKEIILLLKLFLASLAITSIYNVLYYNQIIGNFDSDDIRGLSRFASHIRYGLLIVLGFGLAIWLQFDRKKFSILYTLLAVWFTFYTIYSQVLSGTVAYASVLVLGLFYLLYHWKKKIAYVFFIGCCAIVVLVLGYFSNFSHEQIDCAKLPKYTENGYKYTHNCRDFSEFNGKALMAYYSEMEMFLQWSKRSEVDFMGLDAKGQMLRMTACRYMTGIGLTKDSIGFSKMSADDIKNIEDGYLYPNERNEIFMPRIYGLKFQLLNRSEPNGHSLLQRIEHWRAAFHSITKYPIIGVGTGGNQKAFDVAYEEINSPLTKENRLRSHNMFLAYGVSYGVLGTILFLLFLFYCLRVTWKAKDFIGLMFLVVISTSFLIEDTLETQLGVTIFGFFMALIVNRKRLIDTGDLSRNRV